MTALPAETFGLKDRGQIAPGMVADVVAFTARQPVDHVITRNHVVERRPDDVLDAGESVALCFTASTIILQKFDGNADP